MFIRSNRFRKLIEEKQHGFGVGVRQDEREGVVRTRLDGGEDVGEGEALVAQFRRALTALPLDMADPALLADARFILEEQTYPLITMRALNYF